MKKSNSIALVALLALLAGGAYWWWKESNRAPSPEFAVDESVRNEIAWVTNPEAKIEALRLALDQLIQPAINRTESARLQSFLLGSKPELVSDGAWHAFVNDTVEKLAYDHLAGDSLTGILIAMFEDESQDPVLRDYALQHLGSWYANSDPTAAVERDEARRVQILNTLVKASRHYEERWSATALLSLERIIQVSLDADEDAEDERPEVYADLELLKPALAALIEDEQGQANLLARITALHIAADAKMPEATEWARRIAPDISADANLRLAAIAIVGQHGSAADERMLRQILTERGEAGRRLKFAATPALESLLSAQAPK